MLLKEYYIEKDNDWYIYFLSWCISVYKMLKFQCVVFEWPNVLMKVAREWYFKAIRRIIGNIIRPVSGGRSAVITAINVYAMYLSDLIC